MSVEYPIASLASRLRLSAIRALHGQLITQDISWKITPSADSSEPILSNNAQPIIELHAASYQITAHWNNREIDCGKVILRRGYCRDVVVLMHEAGEPETDEGYFVDSEEVNKLSEHQRRILERDQQRRFGQANGPLANPNPPQGENGQAYAQHPLLDVAQFDGIDPSASSEPAVNQEATEKTLELQLQEQLQNAPSTAPRANPYHS